ncbi:hypothetical protein VN97_g10085, partial [Penicillium thymicola]
MAPPSLLAADSEGPSLPPSLQSRFDAQLCPLVSSGLMGSMGCRVCFFFFKAFGRQLSPLASSGLIVWHGLPFPFLLHVRPTAMPPLLPSPSLPTLKVPSSSLP